MSNTSRVMSNREYEKFMKEKKIEAFKKCDPVVQADGGSMNNNTMLEAEQAYLDQHRKKP
ncbi:hypothetical protein MEQU1_002984 [Malassezia equina]|uniref:Uncharacterized protein n=1 Tax=Malassezia equina TaxID=1381935 RepID=A0AAF0EEN3_9BASI|nr:hypothetical protein MEQU1_002984 [Malassezia equina]